MGFLFVSFSSSFTRSYFMIIFLIFIQTYLSSSAILLSLRNHHSTHNKRLPVLQANRTTCNLFSGTWLRDDSYPIYQSNCPTIDPQFNCKMSGRPDSDYQRYQWKPVNCELPRFDGLEFLLRMRGKSVMFVGDSLGRNQFESLICMISTSVPHSSTQLIRGYPLSKFNFLDYGVSMLYYKAPYLVDIDAEQGKRVMRLDEISGNGNAWRGIDVLCFNTGHWWSHIGDMQGWDYMELGGTFYKDMDRLVAFERALKTWARWVDKNVDTSKTRVFFQSISPDHYNPAEWNTVPVSKNCYGETMPLSGAAYTGDYTDQMRIIYEVLRGMSTPTYLLDITALSELRKDGHPSIYSGDLSPVQKANPDQSADCSHWCLPGVPDMWNQLFYTALFF